MDNEPNKKPDSLIGKIKSLKKKAKKKFRVKPDINSSFKVLTDEEVSLVLAHRAKKARVKSNLMQKEMYQAAGLSSSSTYSGFEQTGKVSLVNFIKIMRALGRVSELESLLKEGASERIDAIENHSIKTQERVRK